MKYLSLIFGILVIFNLSAQSSPFTPKEKLWMDSVNSIIHLENSCFDSLMKADGRSVHYKNEKEEEVWMGYRVLNPESPPEYRASITFNYIPAEKQLWFRGETIYLLKSGPVFVEGAIGLDGPGTFCTIIRTLKDTLYYSTRTPGLSVLPGLEDTSKKTIVIAGPGLASILIAGKFSFKTSFPYTLGNQYYGYERRELFHFIRDTSFKNGNNPGKGFDKNAFMVSLDSVQKSRLNDSTVYLLLAHGAGLNDTARHLNTGILLLDSVIAIPPAQIERRFAFNFSASSYVWNPTRKERRLLKQFCRKNKRIKIRY